MTNDKDLFSQINDLFEDVTVDQASNLIGEELTPSQTDYEKELIEKLNKNEFELTDSLVEEIKENIEQGGQVDKTLTHYLREKFGLAAPEVVEEPEVLTEDVVAQPEVVEEPVREDYISQYADQLSGVIKKSQESNLRDRWAKPDDPQMRGDIYEKIEALTVQLNMMRSTLTEATMVSGIGQGGDGQTPGSGEVRINRMDDVELGPEGIEGLQPGDVLVWDPDCNKGEGCWVPKPGDDIGTDTSAVFGKIWSCKTLKADGDLYWGTNSDYVNGDTTNLVRAGVRSIEYALSIDYVDNNNGTYTGTWLAFGAVGGGVDIIPAPSFAGGTSGPNGPEGFYLLGDCDDTPTQDLLNGTIHGCTKFENVPGDLFWGTQDELELGMGVQVAIPGKVSEILESVSTNADPVTRVGDWTCIYLDENGVQLTATVYNQKDGPNDNGFYVLNGECSDPDFEDDKRPKLGKIIGCAETADEEAPIKWGNKFQADNNTGDSVTTPDTMAKKILAVVGKDVDDAGYGTWTCIYIDKNGDVLTVDYDGTSSIVGPEGFFLETANCADDADEPIDEDNPLFGITTGCKLVNAGGDLRFGTNDDYKNDTGTTVATDAKEIIAVFSLNADPTTLAGTWTCIYKDINDDLLVADSEPDNDKTSPDYGFFIKGATCDGDEDPDSGRPDGFKFGLITGCRELETPDGPLYWGTRADSDAGLGKDTGKRAARILFNFSIDADDKNNGTWNCLYRDTSAQLLIHPEAGQSPMEGFFIAGNNCKEDGDVDGELGPILGETHGCVRVIPKGVLYWGTEEDADPDDTANVGLKIDDDVTQIVAIVGENVYDNMYGEWRCVYRKGAGSPLIVSSPQIGINPEDSYYLIADAGGQCVEDGFNPNPPDDNDPEYGQTIGCNESLDPGITGTSDVWWADNRAAIGLGNGVQKTTSGDIKKIISVFSYDEPDVNGDREWTCLYQTFKLEFGFVVHTGKSPDGGFYLLTPNCAGDDSIDVPGDELEPDLSFGKPVGCPETELTDPGNLYWSNLTATTAGENGTMVDGDGDVLKILFTFTLDKLYRSWNCFYEKQVGTALIKYPSVTTGETYRSWPWGFHIADGVCAVDPNPEPDPPEGNGKPVFGIITGCKKMEETIGTANEGGFLYFGTSDDAQAEDGSGSFGKVCSDLQGNAITNAVRIISVVSFNSDNTRYGTWICIFKDASGATRQAASVGRSPLQGYYLYGNTCDPDGDIDVPLECNDTADCPEGMQCVDGKCVLIPCNDIGECPPGLVCFNGMCFKPCTPGTPGTCPPGFDCVEVEPGLHLCVPPGFPIVPDVGCNGDVDCPEGFHCVGGQCVQLPCDKDGFCPPGLVCVHGHCYKPCDPNDPNACPPGFECTEVFPGVFVCVNGNFPPGGDEIDPPECGSDSDCPPGYTCIGGFCVLLPCPPGGCPAGTICIAGHCFPECDITNPDACPPGFECHELKPGIFVCLPGGEIPGGTCTDDADCPPGYICDPSGSGFCIPKPCTDDADCGPNGFCFQGHCYEKCDPNAPNACPPGFDCVEVSPGDFICMPTWPIGGNCDKDGDCYPGYICINGICVPDRCDDGTTCPPGHICFQGVCYPICGPGLPDCPPGHLCVDIGGDTVCMPGPGGGCFDDGHCPPGFICLDGICIPDRCDNGTPCGPGLLCFEGVCYEPCNNGKCPPGYECVEALPGLFICMPSGGGGGGGEIELDDIYFGYLPGCKVTGDSGAPLKFGEAQIPAGDPIVNSITDCKAIVFSFAVDDGTPTSSYDPLTGIGDWTCVYTDAAGQLKSTEWDNAGPSPLEGFYIDTPNCEDEDPNQPAPDPERIDTTPIGCAAANPAATLKWGTKQDAIDGTGTDIIDTDVTEILYTGYENLYTNNWADQVVIYNKLGVRTMKTTKVFRQNPIADVEYGFFLDVVADDVECVDNLEEHSPIEGAINGCREVSREGFIYWGTRDEYDNLIVGIDDETTTPAYNTGVMAKLIIAVVSIDCDDTGLGNWDINYQTLDGTIGTTTVYGRSGNAGPQGAWILPTDDSVCLTERDDYLRKIYTDEVILRKVDNIAQGFSTIYSLRGGNPLLPFDHQDNANVLFTEELTELNRRKPTMVVAKFTGDTVNPPDYLQPELPTTWYPQTGDLWLDPNPDPAGIENIMRAAIVDRSNFNPVVPDFNDLIITWVIVSGDGGMGGANTTRDVYLIKTVEFYQNYSSLIGLTPEEFEEQFRLVTQEDYNVANAEMLKLLHELKPTIHVVPDIHKVNGYRPQQGDIWINSDNYRMYIAEYNRVKPDPRATGDELYISWIEVGGGGSGGGGNNIIIAPTPPTAMGRGDLWIDENTYYVYVWEGTTYVALTGDLSALTKEFKVHMGPTPPVDSELYVGKLWFDTETSEMRIYYDNKTALIGSKVWIPVFNPGVDRQMLPDNTTFQAMQRQMLAMERRLAFLERRGPADELFEDVGSDPSGTNPYS